ncbi:MAG: ABC transporter permease [Lachnospiraceae bacterium]|nr:ABC transporter permease [Lachnospiraceae bacterium]
MFSRFIKDLKQFGGYTKYAAKSQLKSEVANSYLNWLWWVLDPICFMLIYTFIFGVVFNGKELYFPAFIFVGISMWDFFNRCVKASVKMVRGNKAVVSKVYLPKFILVLIDMMVNGFKMLISFAIVIGMMIFYRVPLHLTILWFFPILFVFILFTFGCCMFLLHYGVYVEDLSNVVNIVLRIVFYMTGIFYDVEKRLPKPYGKYLSRCNPLAYMIGSARNAVLYGRAPSVKLLLVLLLVALLLIYLGLRLVYKNENNYVKVI